MEEREALDACLRMLDPVDEQIIRMKYYGGMTAKEIAASLGLPYETVKKRHQRSLKKLKKSMLIGMVVALLAALLAACAYVVLRYFGVVPVMASTTIRKPAFTFWRNPPRWRWRIAPSPSQTAGGTTAC